MRPSHLLTPSWSPISTRPGALTRALGLSCILALAASANAPAQSFTEITDGMTDAHHGASTWGDYDNDGDLDALVTGETPPPGLTAFADIYQNTSGSFSAISAGLTPTTGSTGVSGSAWGDFDNDGDLDVIITGQTVGPGVQTKLYRNTGGAFAAVTITPSSLINVAISSVAWGDYDNDGDLDLFVSGYNSYPTMTLYRNDGDNGSGGWIFTDVNPAAFTPKLGASASAWGDYDNDGDMDLIVSGYSMIMTGAVTRIYRNDGGVLVNSGINNIVQVGMGGTAWGDVNNDGWLDLVITGYESVGYLPHFKVYTNNQNGTFTLSATHYGVGNSSVTLGDYNNDGKLDIVAIGVEVSSYSVTFAYKGNGDGTFTEDLSSGLMDPFGMHEGQASFGDYDNDGRLDLIMTGRGQNYNDVFTRVYHNTTGVTANTPPTTPTGLSTTAVSSNSITVQWNASTDAQSPAAALHYNLKVVNQTTGVTVMSPMSNASGYRQVAQLGNTDHRRKWMIGGLTPGNTYLVSVQAIDQAYRASVMSPTISVTTTTTQPEVMIADCAGDVGAEPNTACTDYWTSPSIYVRNIDDGLLPGNDVHQAPLSETTNWIYVKIKNIGTAAMPSGRVHVYFAKASTGLGWPAQWTGNYVGGVPYGDYIGQADIVTPLLPGNTFIAKVQWNNVPDPSVYGDPDAHHFCLLARFVSAEDPIAVPEVISINDNTINNNNIAWKNVSIIDVDGPFAILGVGNIQDYQVTAGLMFAVPNTRENLLKYCKVQVDLGQGLYARWREGGFKGTGIEPVEGSATEIRILSTQAQLDMIRMNAGEQFNIRVKFIYPDQFDRTVAGKTFLFKVAQTEQSATRRNLVGGETYEVTMPRQPSGKTAVGATLSSVLKLSASPNPTSAATTIRYTLPEDSRVTLGLYDVAGRLVRTLVPASDQGAGEHTVEWDGVTAAGETVPSGVYFYRIETSDGTAQGQIRITR